MRILSLVHLLLLTVMQPAAGASSSSSLPHGAYGPDMLARVPMMQLLRHASQHQEAYSTLYPSLLCLTITHLPQLCLVESWLREETDTG